MSGNISRVMVELQSPNQTVSLIDNLRYSKVQIESISIPHMWYYIPSDSVVTFIDTLGVTHTFIVTKGSPSIDQILTTIVAQLNLLETGVKAYAYTVNNQTLTWTITNTNAFILSFTAVLAQHLGLTVTTAYNGWGMSAAATSLTSGRFFMTNQQILIRTTIGAKGQSISYDNLTAEKASANYTLIPSRYLVSWPVQTSFGQVETYFLGDFGIIFDITSGDQSIQIQITDEFGNQLDFTPQRAYMTLIYSCSS